MKKTINKRLILKILGLLIVIVALIGGYKEYQNHRNMEARKEIKKVCSSTYGLDRMFSDYQIVNVNVRKKIIVFQLNEELTNALNYNLKAYVEDNVSVISRLMDETDKDTNGQGNLTITGSQIQPICYALATNKKFVKDYGKGWTIYIYNAQGKEVYIYRDDKFLDKPELHVAAAIEKGQEEHDKNATEITKSVIDAIGNNSR